MMSGVYGYQVYDYGVTIVGSFGLWVCIILSIFIYFILEFNLSSESISENIQDIKDRVSSLRKEGEKETEAEMEMEEESIPEKPEEPKAFQRSKPTIPVIGKEPEAISISFEDDETEKKSVE